MRLFYLYFVECFGDTLLSITVIIQISLVCYYNYFISNISMQLLNYIKYKG